ncbi:GAF domain-containing sensor histidine kinase [Chelatococcus reniformis]|uniref:histidine kinase n=1 Tax=Chelatococcus reniformis TaxID=1494448 RepID=A0A916XMT5_9HYPH|nr:GAF domain-containing sensor histidine kinase [Chelatococcus reniformis]GGC87838.1 sensor histidine kinase [Chelatococcus reniformis]
MSSAGFETDVELIASIEAVPSILQVVCDATGMGFSAVARVTEGRWIACSVLDRIDFGLKPGGELQVTTTICNEIRQSGQLVVIDHVAQDQAFCSHPTPAIYGFQSYISVPIVLQDGTFFGTLCAIDPRPNRLKTPAVIGMFQLFAELIAFHISAGERLARSEASLLDERATAELREQFIAVVGHDLRNPLASISGGVHLLRKEPLTGRALAILQVMQGSVTRMSSLISNVLDFARGRLGGGISLDRGDPRNLGPTLEQVLSELSLAHPDRRIETDLTIPDALECDCGRIGQMLSNLLANALTHGDPADPISVEAKSRGGAFLLSVSNSGKAIPEETVKRLFQPYTRGESLSKQGLGLGLFIASEIARAHGGILTVISTDEETRFTFEMPLRA